MKILHIIGNIADNQGGPSKGVISMCRALSQEGHDVTLFTTNMNCRGAFLRLPNRDDVLEVPTNKPIICNGFEIRYFSVDWPSRYMLSRDMAKALIRNVQEFDVVHIHSLYVFTTLMAAYCCRKFNVPYLIRPHGTLDPFLRRKSRFRKLVYNVLFEKRNLNHAAAIHYTTEEEMELTRSLGIKAPGIVVPLGLDLTEFAQLPPYGIFRSKYQLGANKKIILFLGRINFKKGLDILANAFGQVARYRGDVVLVIVGPDNEGYARRVKQWLQDERVLNQTVFVGMLKGRDKLSVFRDSDLFVLPSYSENFGISVVEAMACGLPVVTSNKVNIWREIAGAGAGLVVDCDKDQLVETILKLLDHSGLRQEMGINGKVLVEQKFTSKRMVENLIRAYSNILNGNSYYNE